MKLSFLLLAGVLSGYVEGAVIYRAEPQTIVGLTADGTIAFDFDGNGTEDWRVEAFYAGLATPMIEVVAPMTTNFLYEYSASFMRGVDFQPLSAGDLIGPEAETNNIRFGHPSGIWPARLASGFPLPDPREGDFNFIGQTAYLGFSFQGEEGLHYGYALFTDTSSRGTTILATGWESEVGRPIRAGAVPEPSGMVFLASAVFLAVGMRKRGAFK